MLLIPLAVTSTRGMQRRLGSSWAKLHRLVYVIAVLGLVHYWWQMKSDADFAEPLLYAFLLAVLLGVRLHGTHAAVSTRETRHAGDVSRVEPPKARRETRH